MTLCPACRSTGHIGLIRLTEIPLLTVQMDEIMGPTIRRHEQSWRCNRCYMALPVGAIRVKTND